jgi:hypothetical protein
VDPTPWHGKPAPPVKNRDPPGTPPFLTSDRCRSRASNRAFFALAFEVALRATPPSVMRNGCPRKKVGASTYSSSGPAMKSGLISTRCGVGRAGSSQASGRDVLPIRKDRRQARGERHQLLHLAMSAHMSPLAFRAQPR